MQKEKTENSDLISILMPTYNVEKFVEEAVRSILFQTYKNFELIIVDDCSTDKTFEILARLAEEDMRIKLYRNEVNSKICKTLNKAFQHSKGAYIGRMDGDDISTPKRFEILKHFLDENKYINLVGSNMITIDEDGNELSQKRYIRTNQYIQRGNHYQPCIAHIWLARREVYEVLNGYRDVPYVEDWDFLLRGENQGFKYANIDAFIYKCRIRNGNTGTTNGLRQRKAGRYILKLYKKEKDSHRDEFNENDYLKAIKCTEDEQKKYQKAAKDLDLAIHSRKNKTTLVKYTIKAFFESKFIARYLYETTILRIVFKIESSRSRG